MVSGLRQLGAPPQVPATVTVSGFGREIASPPSRGVCRLIDGTHILVSGESHAEGDPITGRVALGPHALAVDAVGLVAVRASAEGGLAALAAGGLRSLSFGSFVLALDDPLDLALWRGADGEWHGVVQGLYGALPEALSALTRDWLRLALPEPLP